MNKNVLLIEDDLQMQSLIIDYLQDYGFSTTAFMHPKDAINSFKQNSNYSIIILDLMLPYMDGFDLFKKLKEIKNIPIIISSARGDIGNKIQGFEIGADDYLAKPYEPRELVLRIEYILKQTSLKSFKVSNFKINKENRTIFIDDYLIDFTKVEFEIFIYLFNFRT